MTEELEVIISKDEKYLLDSKQSAASIFGVGEGRCSWILRNSGDYLPGNTGYDPEAHNPNYQPGVQLIIYFGKKKKKKKRRRLRLMNHIYA
jgi:hypothetical protein